MKSVVVAGTWFFLCARPAVAQAAEPPGAKKTVHVLGFDSEGADEQAEALTSALRARVRGSSEWSLGDSSTTLSLATAALKCPTRPDPPCLQRLGDELKADRILYGWVKRDGPRRVVAEAHFWRRGQMETFTSEQFADNLREGNDETVRLIARRMLERMSGEKPVAALAVQAGEAGGQVFVDGAVTATLERGHAILELAPGRHRVEIRSPGFVPEVKDVVLAPGADESLSVHLQRAPKPRDSEHSAPPPVSFRTVAALTSLGIGIGFGVAGTVEGVRYLSLQSDNAADHKNLNSRDFCDASQPHGSTEQELRDACSRVNDARSALTLELVFYGVGAVLAGVGLTMLVTDSHHQKRRGVSLTPHVAPGRGELDLGLRF